MKLENIHVGDFVRCRSRYHRAQLEISDDPGLVIEIKRSNSKVLYPGDKRVWLPREMTTRVRVEPGYAPLLEKLNYLLKRVHAHECEFTAGPEIHRLSVQIDEIDLAVVDDVRSFLGDGLLSLRIVPEGMAFMQIQIEFKAGL